MVYSVEILVMNRESVLDAEAKAIKGALESLGFEGINSLRYGKSFTYLTEQETEELARKQADEICKKYLANSVNEQYEIVSIKKMEE